MSEKDLLIEGLVRQGTPLVDRQIEQLLAYLTLLEKWNQSINLTAIRERERMVTHHLLDCLSVLPFMPPSGCLADIGSGAGLPGIPLAIARPDWSLSLIEPNQKRVAFLRQVKGELGLNNVSVLGDRVEDVDAGPFDWIISRAFADLPDFVKVSGRLLSPGGSIVAMKGVVPYEEIDRLPTQAEASIEAISIPELAASRHLIFVRFNSSEVAAP